MKAVRVEMMRIYKAGRRGEIENQDMARFALVLQGIAKILEQSDLEARLEQLEHSLKLQQQPPLRNGVNHANN